MKTTALITTLALLLLVPVIPAQASPHSIVCTDVNTPISVPGAANGTIYGRYCRSGEQNGRPLQILVPGITYTNSYFDLPGFGGQYSYARFMNGHGYDTLAIDRLGIGRSSRPLLAANVTAYSNANALHQVVASVRANGLPGRTYDDIVLTGHSYGTLTSDLASATYHDVDGIIGTGWLAQPTLLGAAGVAAILYPAALDPRFIGTIIDPVYVTTRPGTRGFFYQASNADPAVIALDDATKNTASLAELTYLVPANLGLTARIGVPTLRIVGEFDRIMCNPTPCTQERMDQIVPALFGDGAEAYTQDGAGHNIALEFGNLGGFQAALSWLQDRFPTS